MILTILQTIVFITYITFLVKKFGVLPSISESWYRLQPEKLGYLFTLFCLTLGILMLYQGTQDTSLFFISGVGLCFVGAATQFKINDYYTGIIHSAGAAICIVSALVGIGIEYNLWLPGFGFIILTIPAYIFIKKNKTWWIEMLAFISILIGLIIINF